MKEFPKELPGVNQYSELQGRVNASQERPALDVLRQKVAEGQKRQKSNQELLATVEETFNQSAQRVDKLVSWSIERPVARTRSIVTISHRIIAAERLKIDLEDYTELLHNEDSP